MQKLPSLTFLVSARFSSEGAGLPSKRLSRGRYHQRHAVVFRGQASLHNSSCDDSTGVNSGAKEGKLQRFSPAARLAALAGPPVYEPVSYLARSTGASGRSNSRGWGLGLAWASDASAGLELLLQAELDSNGQVHGHRFAVKRGRLIFPLPQSFHGGLLEERRAGKHFHPGDAPVGIDQRINRDSSGNVLGLCQ